MQTIRVSRFALMVFALVATVGLATTVAAAQIADQSSHTTNVFAGVKVNVGTVTHTKVDGKNVLTLSDDFKVPNVPDPHWQVIDSQGTVYVLDRLQAKNGKYNKSIILPAYVKDVAKVQIWCAFAETVLGEASFESPVM